MYRGSRGYTLVEMMIVLAIVSILAVLGVNSYQDAVAIARISHMKSQLGQAFAAERAFFSEWTSYTYCLRQINGLPIIDPGAPREFFIGFSNGADFFNCGPAGNQSCFTYAAGQPNCACGGFGAGGNNDCGADATVGASLTGTAGGMIWRAQRLIFEVGAAGNVRSGQPPEVYGICSDKIIRDYTQGRVFPGAPCPD